jgi:hypothetical protein
VAIASASPTAERLAHGAVAPPQIDEHAFKPFWRACDRLDTLLEMALIEEMPWGVLGRRLGIDPHTARTWCVAAISALAAL